MNTFLLIAIIHFFAVIAPGPAFIAIFNHSIREKNFKNILKFIFGIVLADGLIIAISLTSLSDFIIENKICNLIIHIIGGISLFYIGFLITKSNKITTKEQKIFASNVRGGFLFTMVNPKAILFYIGLFTLAIHPDTTTIIKLGYVAWILCGTMIYFSTLGFIFFLVREKVFPYISVLSKIFGLAIAGFAILVITKGFSIYFA